MPRRINNSDICATQHGSRIRSFHSARSNFAWSRCLPILRFARLSAAADLYLDDVDGRAALSTSAIPSRGMGMNPKVL